MVTTTDYAGSYIYENSALKFFNQAEGYIEPDGAGGYDYVYQYKDHLGNIRLSYRDNATLLSHIALIPQQKTGRGNSALISQENGMLRVDTDIAWGGAQKYFDIAVGDEISPNNLYNAALKVKNAKRVKGPKNIQAKPYLEYFGKN